MSTIREYAGGNDYFDDSYASKYKNYSNVFLEGLSVSSDNSSAFNLSDYAMIKNGTYGKLMKAYYAKEKAEQAFSGGDSKPKLSLMAGNAGSMAKSAQALMQDSLWEKKTIKEKDEKTGEETEKEDYDWKAITKALKSFIDDYNATVEGAGESNNKNVLRNAAWMTKTTSMSERLLNKVGISVGSGNKLELDEDKLKEADISTLKTLFTGHNSYADKMMSKGNAIAMAAANAGGTYTSSGTYSSALSQLVSGKIDTKE